DYQAELFSVDPTALETSSVSSGIVTVSGVRPYPEALLLVPAIAPAPAPEPEPEPALAATGGVVDGSLVTGAAVLALLGFGMVAFRRKRTA
ncbi:MAG: hypothetical protein JWO10_1572, partial [Microbacteriaceae bacterium]|nr:hypothetical protein [Microbacteriaceae bacterium]